MTVCVEDRSGWLTASSGISPDSEKIKSKSREAFQHNQDTASSLWRQSALSEVHEILLDCSKEGWDGYDAEPITYDSFVAALEIINSLPEKVVPPCIAPEPSGEIAMEWRIGNQILLSISVTGREIVYAAILGGGSKLHGQERYFDSLPSKVLEILARYFRKA